MAQEWLSTTEAARRLGVKHATLYAYVSRGLLASHRVPGHRGSAFAAADVDQLAERTAGARRGGGAAESTASAVTALDGDDLHFRGHRAVLLAAACPQGCSFEAVAELLWTTTLPAGPVTWPAPPDGDVAAVAAVVAALGPSAPAPQRLRVAAAALPARGGAREPAVSVQLLVAALRSGPAHPGFPSAPARLAEQLTVALLPPGRAPSPQLVDAVETAMVLLADHGLAVSTLAARVAASARAPLPGVLSAALGAAGGPVHTAASREAGAVLARVVRDGAAAAEEAWRGGTPAGFGHLLYAAADPRAEHLLRGLPAGPVADAVDALCAAAPLRADAFPNVDLALAALAGAHELLPDAGQVVFEVARTAGWIAHAAEEAQSPALRYRVPGRYDGALPGAR